MEQLNPRSYVSSLHYARWAATVPWWLLFSFSATAAELPVLCGAERERLSEILFHARQGEVQRAAQRWDAGRPARRAVGELALLDSGGGVVNVPNWFDLEGRVVRFVPDLSFRRYRIEMGEAAPTLRADGARLTLGDDDTRRTALPFSFPFFGQSWAEVWINSDGNLTFQAGDASTSARSVGRLVSGPPRIAGLFRDLDPSVGGEVRLSVSPDWVAVTWLEVPEYRSSGIGPRQSFQIRISRTGRIELEFSRITTDSAVVGLSPGVVGGPFELLDLSGSEGREITAAAAESFLSRPEIDVVRASQRFLEAFGDGYDYLIFFNDFGLRPGNAIAFQVPVRISGSGYGLPQEDHGLMFGSRRRLQSVINMGPTDQYPLSPDAALPGRSSSGESVLAVLGHELGHQYLAFADLPGLLGRQRAHWSFFFHSDASLLEGNRLEDRGPAAQPRFISVAAAEGYSALDRYLMGLIPAEQVPPSFYVQPFFAPFRPESPPAPGATFDGRRVDITVQDIRNHLGRRIPDHTVAQTHFRVAFILIHREGQDPSPATLAQLEGYRAALPAYFNRATRGQASLEATLREPVQFSLAPHAGIVAGQTGRASIEIAAPRTSPLTFQLRADSPVIEAPSPVTIPAGERRVEFLVRGLRPGRASLLCRPENADYEAVTARLAVTEPASILVQAQRVQNQIEVRISDENGLPYAGVPIRVTSAGGSAPASQTGTTDESGRTRMDVGEAAEAIEVEAAGIRRLRIGPAPVIVSVLNAASLDDRLSPGVLASVFGANLEGAAAGVRLESQPVRVLRESPGHLLVALPEVTPAPSTSPLTISARGATAAAMVRLAPAAPAIFIDGATERGAVIAGGVIRDFAPGETVEAYATGLGEGPVSAFVGQRTAQVLFAGRLASIPGLWQVNLTIPEGTLPGLTVLILESAGVRSNPVRIGIAPRP